MKMIGCKDLLHPSNETFGCSKIRVHRISYACTLRESVSPEALVLSFGHLDEG